MKQKHNFKWTSIFVIRGAGDNTNELTELLNQLASVNKSEDTACVICINIRLGATPPVLRFSAEPISGNDATQWTTLFYFLKSKPDGMGCTFELIREIPRFSLGSEKDIKGFFKRVVLKTFSADRYILFTWDHGQPFGIFSGASEEPSPSKAVDDEKVIAEAFHFRLAKQLKDETREEAELTAREVPEDKLPILTITELKQAIQWAFGATKIDIVVMANCYLQFFDTGYELSSCANYLVAFETLMFFRDSFDYKMILDSVGNDPNLTPETLSKNIVLAYGLQRNKRNIDSKNEIALFANDLSWYPVMAKLIDTLALSLIEELPRYREAITAAINRCEYISLNTPSFCLVDFGNFIRCLYTEIPETFGDRLSIDTFEKVLQRLVVASYIGNSFKDPIDTRFVRPSCFSIYLPREKNHFKAFFLDNFMAETSLSPTEFVKRFQWEAFVAQYANQ